MRKYPAKQGSTPAGTAGTNAVSEAPTVRNVATVDAPASASPAAISGASSLGVATGSVVPARAAEAREQVFRPVVDGATGELRDLIEVALRGVLPEGDTE